MLVYGFRYHDCFEAECPNWLDLEHKEDDPFVQPRGGAPDEHRDRCMMVQLVLVRDPRMFQYIHGCAVGDGKVAIYIKVGEQGWMNKNTATIVVNGTRRSGFQWVFQGVPMGLIEVND